MSAEGIEARPESTSVKPRNGLGLLAIALLLGAPALMMWMGRFKLALFYFLCVVVLVLIALVAKAFDFLPRIPAGAPIGNGIDDAIWLLQIVVAVSALWHAFKLNKQSPVRPWYSKWFVALPCFTVIALFLAFLVRTFLFQPFNIPSVSNHPNLVQGDFIFVSKTAYVFGDPVAGEIAVFKHPQNSQIDYVKRVIGLPGDRVQLKDGVVFINGEAVKRDPASLPDWFLYADGLTAEPLTFFRESLPNGKSYLIADSGKTDFDNTEEYLVPDGHYFALGDNRDNSADSRIMGAIPRQNFIGPFSIRFWNDLGFPMRDRPEEKIFMADPPQ